MKKTFNLSSDQFLEGGLVILRHPKLKELDFINELWTDFDTMETLGGVVCWSNSKLKEWYEDRVDPGGLSDCFFLIYKKDGTPVGEVSFHRWIPEERTADLNIKIQSKFRHNGYAKDAMKLFLRYYFEDIEGKLLVDDLLHTNLPGRRLMESMNFEHDSNYSEAYRMIMSRERYFNNSGRAQQVAGGDGTR